MNKILPCHAMLYTWGITDSNKCHYCNLYDSITHHLYECVETKQFWKHVMKWVGNNMDVNVPLSKIDVLFGIPIENDYFILCLNLLIILGKWYVHTCKTNEKKLFVLDFLPTVKDCLALEEYTMSVNGKDQEFEMKWGLLNNALA